MDVGLQLFGLLDLDTKVHNCHNGDDGYVSSCSHKSIVYGMYGRMTHHQPFPMTANLKIDPRAHDLGEGI